MSALVGLIQATTFSEDAFDDVREVDGRAREDVALVLEMSSPPIHSLSNLTRTTISFVNGFHRS
jgi:hypothetical protein